MIIQTGSRTDIPAFYSEWFCNRLKEGYVLVRSPYDPMLVSRYELNPKVVDAIAFCTKNPAPMLPHMDLLKPYGQYWYVTITPYGKDIEPNVPPKEEVIESFKTLSLMLNPDAVGWRYDPIFLSEKYTAEWHIEEFTKMAEALRGFTHTCVISFIDLYEKVKRNFPEVRPVNREDRLRIGKAIIEIAKKNGMVVKPCAEGTELAAFGADCGGCMTIETYEKAIGMKLDVPARKTARAECACYLNGDIGQYDTCAHFCRYCYANNDHEAVIRNRRLHDPKSPLLVGHIEDFEGKIHIVPQKSWKNGQISVFDML